MWPRPPAGTPSKRSSPRAPPWGQTVKVRGQVVKFTPNIMGTNWVHIQDGTGSGETADLTVTTSAIVAAGDIVVVEGPDRQQGLWGRVQVWRHHRGCDGHQGVEVLWPDSA